MFWNKSLFRLPLHLGMLCLLAASFPAGVRGDAATAQNNPQTAERNSKFYLLLDDDSLYSNQPYQTQIKQINSLGRAQDLKGLARLADSIEQTWGHKTDTRGYFALMDEVTSVLRSDDFGPNSFQEQYRLTQKYVLATLAHGNVPLDITSRLLPCLIPEEKLTLYKRPFSDADWAQMRRLRAPLWLQTRQRLKQLVIPDYDFTSPVFMGFPIDIQALTDTKRAEARSKEIQENDSKIRGRNTQSLIRFLDKLFSPMAENEMISYYSHSPYDLQELQRFLDTYVEDPAVKQRIVIQVARNMATGSQKQP